MLDLAACGQDTDDFYKTVAERSSLKCPGHRRTLSFRKEAVVEQGGDSVSIHMGL
jgi:hypothetical protein